MMAWMKTEVEGLFIRMIRWKRTLMLRLQMSKHQIKAQTQCWRHLPKAHQKSGEGKNPPLHPKASRRMSDISGQIAQDESRLQITLSRISPCFLMKNTTTSLHPIRTLMQMLTDLYTKSTLARFRNGDSNYPRTSISAYTVTEASGNSSQSLPTISMIMRQNQEYSL